MSTPEHNTYTVRQMIGDLAEGRYAPAKAALAYAEVGIPSFRLKVRDKIPAISNGHLRATANPDMLTAMFNPGYRRYNIALVPGRGGFFVVDVDPKDGGLETLATLNLPRTLTVRTPSGGLHFYYRVTPEQAAALEEDGGSTNSGVGPGIDTRFTAGYVAAPGSVTTAAYRFDPEFLSDEVLATVVGGLDFRPLFATVTELPAHFFDLVLVSRSREARKEADDYAASNDGVIENPNANFASVLEGCDFMRFLMDNPAFAKEPPWHAGMSIAGRCNDGQRWAHEMSKGHPEYSKSETNNKLKHALKRPPRTCASIQKKLGFDCSRCPFRNHDKMKSPIKLAYQTPEMVRIMKRSIIGPGSQHIDAETGRVLSRKDAEDSLRVELGPNPHLVITQNSLRAKVHSIAYLAGNENLITTDAKGERAVNIWRKAGVNECEGDPSVILDHFTHMLPNESECKHVLDYIAHTIQRPSIKIGHAVVFSGPQGTGKSTIGAMIKVLFGSGNVTTVGGEGVLKRFNHRLVNTQIALIEEANSGARLEATDALKEWLTAETISAERKGLDEFDGYTPRGVFVKSNHTAPFVIEKGARRWFFPETTKVVQPATYFKALWAAINDPKCMGAFKLWLMDRDISQFSPTAWPPRTKAQEIAENDSLTPASQIVVAGVDDAEGIFEYDLVEMDEVQAYVEARDTQRVAKITLAKVRKALRDAGGEKLPIKVRIGSRGYNLWIVRNHERWRNAEHAELSAAYRASLVGRGKRLPEAANSNIVPVFQRSST